MLKPFGSSYASATKWSLWQRSYIRLFGVVDLPTRIRARYVLSAIPPSEGGRFLDFGAGTGVYTFHLAERGAGSVVAIDAEPARVAEIESIARATKVRNVRTVVGTETKLCEFPQHHFDIVIAVESLQYVRDLNDTLSNIASLLKQGGLFVAHVPVRKALLPWEQRLFKPEMLLEHLTVAGFYDVRILCTFGRGEQFLCWWFSSISRRPLIAAILFPMQLALSWIGCFRLGAKVGCLVVAYRGQAQAG